MWSTIGSADSGGCSETRSISTWGSDVVGDLHADARVVFSKSQSTLDRVGDRRRIRGQLHRWFPVLATVTPAWPPIPPTKPFSWVALRNHLSERRGTRFGRVNSASQPTSTSRKRTRRTVWGSGAFGEGAKKIPPQIFCSSIDPL